MKKIVRWLRLFPEVVFTGDSSGRHLNKVRDVMDRYDMVTSPSEDYFKDRYMHIIDSALEAGRLAYEGLKVLDAGCGQGRLAIAFAKRGSSVDAVDVFPGVLDKARIHAQKAGLSSDRIRWIEGGLPETLDGVADNSYDLVVCAEVLYMLEEADATIRGLVRVLRPGGVLVVSSRTRLYYLAHSLMSKDFLRFSRAAKNNSYKDIGQALSWSDPRETEDLLAALDLKDIRRWGIGVLSGIEGDPTGKFCFPHELNGAERETLGQAEDKIAGVYSDAGRYIVYSGVKNG
ncbi:MAG: class I SAM-dependent methyltransferase [Candidatus Omnitrophica bacterium]|nr:class I SAM-dependent methyltransferase [Candidatus Omnitrophota bacterium]